MKPTRGLSGSWLSHLPRERKVALGSVAFLVVLLGTLVLYQRFGVPAAPGQPLPQPDVPRTPATITAPPEDGKDVTAASEAPGKANTAPEPPKQLVRPLAGRHQVLQPYALLYSEVYGDYRWHSGVDYAAAPGESVLAAGTGRVVRIDTDPVEGKLVELDHGNGLITRYMGLGALQVGMNATVQPGAVIAQVGAPGPEGKAAASHLHFEVLVNGNPVDPATYLQP